MRGLTVAQALVRFPADRYVERDGQRRRFFAGRLGAFGYGNVSGIGEAPRAAGDDLRYHQTRDAQAAVHTAVGYARARDRLAPFACTTSVGPGATNPVTGVDLAANAAGLGADVLRAHGVGFRAASRKAVDSPRTTVVQVETDPTVPAPDSGAWWDVPVAEVSEVDGVRGARAGYEERKRAQRRYL